jgi:hypothetical protein
MRPCSLQAGLNKMHRWRPWIGSEYMHTNFMEHNHLTTEGWPRPGSELGISTLFPELQRRWPWSFLKFKHLNR